MAVQRLDVGGYRLEIDVSGSGRPPVVFVPGLGDTSRESFAAVQHELDEATAVVNYARPGIGASDALEHVPPRSCGAAATELLTLLEQAQIEPPYVLVGHSLGALVSLAFAAQFHRSTAGLVLVDASDLSLYQSVGRFELPDGEQPGSVAFDVNESAQELLDHDIHDIPAVVVTSRAGRWLESKVPHLWHPHTLPELDDRWQRGQQALAERLSARQMVADVGGHYVQRDQPALVAEAVRWTISTIRATSRLAGWPTGLISSRGRDQE